VSRRTVLLLAVVGGVAFLVVSFLLTRVLTASNSERAAAIELVKAQERGDVEELVDRIDGCRERPGCPARIAALTRRLSRPGEVSILNVKAPGFSLTSRTGTTRVAWQAGTADPIVQCVRARRTGDPLLGYDVRVLSLSAPIGNESSCPE
jgi:hypothetical protein